MDPKRVARSLRSQNESKRQLHLGDRSVPKNVCTVKNEILGARKTTLTATGRQAACSELLPSFYVLLTHVLGTASSRQSQQQLQHCLRKNTNAAYRNIGPPRMSVIHFNSLYDRSKGLRTCWWCYVRSWCGVGGKQCIAMFSSRTRAICRINTTAKTRRWLRISVNSRPSETPPETTAVKNSKTNCLSLPGGKRSRGSGLFGAELFEERLQHHQREAF